MAGGYIKLWRSIRDSSLWGSEPFTTGQAWVDLILSANYKTTSFRIRGIVVTVSRGQLCDSEVSLAERWGWSRNRVRRFLLRLQTEQMVEQQKNSVTSIITILNYDRFQGDDTADDTADGAIQRSEQQSIQRSEQQSIQRSEQQSIQQNVRRPAKQRQVKQGLTTRRFAPESESDTAVGTAVDTAVGTAVDTAVDTAVGTHPRRKKEEGNTVPYRTVPLGSDLDVGFCEDVRRTIGSIRAKLPDIASPDDRAFVWKICSLLVRGQITEDELRQSVAACRNAMTKSKPWAYTIGCFRNVIGKQRLDEMLRSEPDPPAKENATKRDPGAVPLAI